MHFEAAAIANQVDMVLEVLPEEDDATAGSADEAVVPACNNWNIFIWGVFVQSVLENAYARWIALKVLDDPTNACKRSATFQFLWIPTLVGMVGSALPFRWHYQSDSGLLQFSGSYRRQHMDIVLACFRTSEDADLLQKWHLYQMVGRRL